MLKRLFLFGFFSFLAILCIFKGATVWALTQEEQEAQWRAELEQTEKDIAKWQSILDSTKANTKSLQQEVAVLNAKIQQAKAFIKQKNVEIAQLDQSITQKNIHIQSLEKQISDGHDTLAKLLRQTNQIDSYSLPEVVLANQNISDFFSDLDTFQSINRDLKNLFVQIRATKDTTEKEKATLSKQKDKESDLKASAESDKKKVEANEKEKEYLIAVNKTQEKTYEQVLAERRKRASEIRAALFNLRDATAIPFGDALRFAQEASAKTGVRPAFILAILTQESDLGANQGSCIVKDITTGDGVGKNTGTAFQQIMKAPRDTVPFQAITSRLGMSIETPVSCPPSAKWTSTRGYGGGMGPSQFIPSTWELMKKEVASDLGIDADSANPWNPEHAIMATALLLANQGAGAGGYTAERNAACKYYSGSACSANRRPPNAFYGDQVVSKANNIQTNMIDPLQNL